MRLKLKFLFSFLFLSGFFLMGPGSVSLCQAVNPQVEEALDAYEEIFDIPVWPESDFETDVPTRFKKYVQPAEGGHSADSQPPLILTQPDADESTVLYSDHMPVSEDLPDDMVVDVLNLKNMEMADVLKLISEKSNLNIIAGRDITGKVSIYLRDVKVKDALRIILDSNGLAYRVEDGIVHVMPAAEYETRYGVKFGGEIQTFIRRLDHANVADAATLLNQMKSPSGKIISDNKSRTLVVMDTPQKLKIISDLLERIDVPVQTRMFDLNYARAQEVAEKIAEILTPDVGEMKYDERSNRLVVTDTGIQLQKVGRIIRAFDIKEKQVLIEAKIIQVVLTDQYKFGIDWEGIVQDYHNLDLKSHFDILSSTSKGGSLSIGTVDADQYTLLIEALRTVGVSNILSSPSITTVNNQEAKILVGSTEPYVTTTTTTTASGPTTTAESVNFIEVGVKLFVTPTIHNDGFITLKIRPEVSSVTSTITTSNNNTVPVVDTSEAETTVMVKDGVTIIIGGLIKEEQIDSINKVPLLGDIPLVGHVFRNTDNYNRKTETVIFLTPKIITGDVPS